jgi:GNAT superfamily N-acetyltransferase
MIDRVMQIKLAITDEQIQSCYPVMQALRPHLQETEFVSRVRSQAQNGYILARIETVETHQVVAVAGFRIIENLASGRFLYVDDLVVIPEQRSNGYGAKLLSWLKIYAARENCTQIHLDSSFQRLAAHRFYERENVLKSGFHFFGDITPP